MTKNGEGPQWTPYSTNDKDEQPSPDEIGYAEASEYQETEFGPLSYLDETSGRAHRLKRREGYSPTEGDKPRFAGALASELNLTQSQTNEIYSVMSDLNLAAFGAQRRIETVALGVITVIVNYDRFQRQQNPSATRIAETSEFRELLKELDIDYSDVGTAKRVVKQELKNQDYF
jgi:hypothetical protein